MGVEFKQPAPKRPDDFFTSMRTATWRYLPRPYGGSVLLLKRKSELAGRYRLKDFGWGEVLGPKLELFDIEGYHWTLLMQPGVAVLAKKLEAAMRAARGGESGVDSSAAAGY
jgi:thioesterase domain-containing protein